MESNRAVIKKVPAILFVSLFLFLPSAFAQTMIDGLVVQVSRRCLPKTGQESCYNLTNQTVTCNSTWAQDARYADPAGYFDYGCTQGEGSWANWNANGGRFVNNTDGTITDSATGLMWVANSTKAGRGGTYTWYNAVTACENLTYATYDDWRLPNAKELQSIVDYGTYNPAIDTNFFVSVSNAYWSSTTHTNDLTNAWTIDFTSGDVYGGTKANARYVRPVRGN